MVGLALALLGPTRDSRALPMSSSRLLLSSLIHFPLEPLTEIYLNLSFYWCRSHVIWSTSDSLRSLDQLPQRHRTWDPGTRPPPGACGPRGMPREQVGTMQTARQSLEF